MRCGAAQCSAMQCSGEEWSGVERRGVEWEVKVEVEVGMEESRFH